MDPFENLIEDIYSAASNPDEWRALMRRVANARECAIRGATLTKSTWASNFAMGHEIVPSDVAWHADLFSLVSDPRLKTAIEQPFQESDFITEEEIRRNVYCQDLYFGTCVVRRTRVRRLLCRGPG